MWRVAMAYCLCRGGDLVTSSTCRYLLCSEPHQHPTWDLVMQPKLSEIGLTIDPKAVLGDTGFICRNCLRDLKHLKKEVDTLLEKAAAAIRHMPTTPVSSINVVSVR